MAYNVIIIFFLLTLNSWVKPNNCKLYIVVHFSIMFCKSKTKLIRTANKNKRFKKYHMEPTRTQELAQARENASDQVAIGFSFTSEWLRRQSKCFKPVIEHSTGHPTTVFSQML